MRFALLGRITLEGYWLEASNVAGREYGAFDISDYAMMRFMLLGALTIPQ